MTGVSPQVPQTQNVVLAQVTNQPPPLNISALAAALAAGTAQGNSALAALTEMPPTLDAVLAELRAIRLVLCHMAGVSVEPGEVMQ